MIEIDADELARRILEARQKVCELVQSFTGIDPNAPAPEEIGDQKDLLVKDIAIIIAMIEHGAVWQLITRRIDPDLVKLATSVIERNLSKLGIAPSRPAGSRSTHLTDVRRSAVRAPRRRI